MTKVVNFTVGMSCEGCKSAVTKVLKKISGVTEVNADLVSKNVAVSCEDSVDPNTLHDALKKWASSSKKSVELLA